MRGTWPRDSRRHPCRTSVVLRALRKGLRITRYPQLQNVGLSYGHGCISYITETSAVLGNVGLPLPRATKKRFPGGNRITLWVRSLVFMG